LKKQSLRITQHDIISVKELMNAYAVTFYDAPNESDQLCAYLVNSGQAWACLSDDMDMFVYGCTRVLKCINLLQQNCYIYDMNEILKKLNITQEEFTRLCVICGTDYANDIDNNDNFNEIDNEKFKHLFEQKKYQDNTNIETENICKLFNTTTIIYEDLISFVSQKNKKTNNKIIQNILELDGFMFP
jgi:5'-3' exonuclease